MPEASGTYGPMVNEFGEKCGLTLFEWQKNVIDRLFMVKANGEWAASEFGVLVARQNGKGEILVLYTLAHLFLFPRRDDRRKTILYTAHETKTAGDGFARIRSVIESVPALSSRVEHIYTANGIEGIILKKRKRQKLGDRVKFVARSKNSGRGFSADIIIQDEAQEESEKAHAALTYTQSAVPNKQEVFFGTAPEDGVNDCAVFEGVRDRGRAGVSETGWMEWTPAGSEDPDAEIDFTDEVNWLAANPSAPHLITLDTIRKQLERDTSPGAATFGRERLSIWPNSALETSAPSDFDMDRWYEHEVSVWLSRRVALAVVVGRGGGYSSICGAQRLDDGSVLVQHLATSAGTLWVAEKLVELRRELGARVVVLDEKNAATITSDLVRAGVRFISLHMSEVSAAFDMTIEHNSAGLLRHPPQPELDDAFLSAVPRVMNKANNLKTWDQGNPLVPSSAVQAVSLALWGLKKSEAQQSRVSPVGPQVLSISDDVVSADGVLSVKF